MADPLYWRVLHVDGSVESEPFDNASIRNARKHIASLRIVKSPLDPLDTAVVEVAVPAGSVPIFYRRRGVGVSGEIELLATVFGTASLDGERTSGTLYAAMDGRIVDCPPAFVDQVAISMQVAV